MQKSKSFQPKKRKNTIILILFGGILILLAIPLSVFLLSTNYVTNHPTSKFSGISLSKKNVVSGYHSDFNLVSYSGNTYTFSYQKSWQKSVGTIAGNKGTAILLKPPSTNTANSPQILIEIADAKKTTLRDMSAGLSLFTYTINNTSISGVAAQKYSQEVMINQGALHTTAYVFEKNGFIYLLILVYQQKTVNSQLENAFTNLVDSFILK